VGISLKGLLVSEEELRQCNAVQGSLPPASTIAAVQGLGAQKSRVQNRPARDFRLSLPLVPNGGNGKEKKGSTLNQPLF